MSIEADANRILKRYPLMKKIIKRTYQFGMYTVSQKLKFEGDIERISPKDGKEYFFGYYDKSPWDATDRYMLCLRVINSYSSAAPDEPAEIILFDTQDNNSYKVLGRTHTWNVQQGCMLQWRGPDYSSEIIYNDFRGGMYCSVILNIHTNEENVLSIPVYSVASDGQTALTLDFSRLHRMRKGYGYSNLPDWTSEENCPVETCIWKVDLDKNEVTPILEYTDLYDFEMRDEMVGAKHKVNHIMINPSGTRFMVLHRWSKDSKKYSRLVTSDLDGSHLFNLSDDDMVSHCIWKNDKEILAYAKKHGSGDGYYLMEDKSNDYKHLWPELKVDGHPSYSPDGELIITDTYPDKSRISTVYCLKENDEVKPAAKFFSPFRYDNEVRCDLHPKWNRAGNAVSVDAVFEGRRGLYMIKLKNEEPGRYG